MDNSLLAVRDINHIYIVVERRSKMEKLVYNKAELDFVWKKMTRSEEDEESGCKQGACNGA